MVFSCACESLAEVAAAAEIEGGESLIPPSVVARARFVVLCG